MEQRARYTVNAAKNKVLEIEMPERSPEEDPGCSEKRTISLYIADRQQVWLDNDHLDWAIRCLYVQHLLKGVPLVAPDSAGPGAPVTPPSLDCCLARQYLHVHCQFADSQSL